MQSLAYVQGSNGSANPSLMTVQTLRSPGATSILVNTVAGAPTKFYGTMGAPHTFTDPVTGETITVISEATAVDFAGTVTSGHVDIVAIAPGYTDTRGSLVGDIIVVRPVTEWANNVFNVLNQSLNDDGTIKNSAITYNANIADYVASGAVLAGLGYGSTLTASLSSGICYINGNLQTIAAVATRTYTANKDTYVDALYSATGIATIVYTEVANNAASPALAANSIRLGIVVSGANIAAATSISQGGFANTLPVISSQILRGFDTLGNTIYPKGGSSPKKTQIGVAFSVYRAAAYSTTTNPNVLPHDTKTYDFGNNVDVTTNKGRFTAPMAGLYTFKGVVSLSVSSAGFGIGLALAKNGTVVKNGTEAVSTAASSFQYRHQAVADIMLAAGDYVEIMITNAAGVSIDVGAANSFFDGYLVSAS